jgi:hypothetical protein
MVVLRVRDIGSSSVSVVPAIDDVQTGCRWGGLAASQDRRGFADPDTAPSPKHWPLLE